MDKAAICEPCCSAEHPSTWIKRPEWFAGPAALKRPSRLPESTQKLRPIPLLTFLVHRRHWRGSHTCISTGHLSGSLPLDRDPHSCNELQARRHGLRACVGKTCGL